MEERKGVGGGRTQRNATGRDEGEGRGSHQEEEDPATANL
jgi:hypothetical protein